MFDTCEHPPIHRVLVMMATYNGSKWVVEQLNSIVGQEDVCVTVRVCDDCSTDDTYDRLVSYAGTHPNVIVSRNVHNLGVAGNFMQMIYEPMANDYDYYAFSDQDDVWLPQKLARAIRVMTTNPSQGPLLYYSDILNVGEQGQSREISRFAGCEQYPATVLIRNYVNGCAMVWNAELQRVARTYCPTEFYRIHDVWLHMLGRYCGAIIADLDFVGSRRRITGENVVGETATDVHGLRQSLALVRLALSPRERASSAMAQAFFEGYKNELNEVGEECLLSFMGYYKSLSGRLRAARTLRFWLPTAQMRLRARVGLLMGFY